MINYLEVTNGIENRESEGEIGAVHRDIRPPCPILKAQTSNTDICNMLPSSESGHIADDP